MIAFLRIPKTASSIFAFKFRENPNNLCGMAGHNTYSYFKNCSHEHEWYTTIRNPMQAHISYYYFIQKRLANGAPHVLAKDPHYADNMRLFAAGATVEEFLDESPTNQTFSYYLEDIDIDTLSFVGVTEQMDLSYRLFEQVSRIYIPSGTVTNVNPEKEVSDPYVVDYSENSFMSKNELDYELYYKCLSKFNDLCIEYGVE